MHLAPNGAACQMESAEPRGAPDSGMEKVEAAADKRQRQRSAVLSVASSLCSVVSVAFCVLLSVNAADIRSRVTGLETAGGQPSSFLCAPGFSPEDFNSLVEQSVDERLSQVSPPVPAT